MASEKIDPLGEEYFDPLLRADRLNDALFYSSAALSIVALILNRASHPAIYDFIQIAFAISVVALFSTGLAIRLYFFPRAQLGRYKDFLSHAFGRPLSHRQSTAYYNNSATSTPGRIAAQVLESAFFSKGVLSQMAFNERVKIGVYLLIWLIAILYRGTDLALIGVVAQIVFSEQILSRWLRLEWFRRECEDIYDELFRLFQSKADLEVVALEFLGRYEIGKATSAISLSVPIFERSRRRMNKEWEKVRKTFQDTGWPKRQKDDYRSRVHR
jgi:hypothetical protein